MLRAGQSQQEVNALLSEQVSCWQLSPAELSAIAGSCECPELTAPAVGTLCAWPRLPETLPLVNNLLLTASLAHSAARLSVQFGLFRRLCEHLQGGEHVELFREMTCYFALVLQELPEELQELPEEQLPTASLYGLMRDVIVEERQDTRLVGYATRAFRSLLARQQHIDEELLGALVDNAKAFGELPEVKLESLQLLKEGLYPAQQFYEQGGLTLCVLALRDKDPRVVELSTDLIARCIDQIGLMVESGLNRTDFCLYIYHRYPPNNKAYNSTAATLLCICSCSLGFWAPTGLSRRRSLTKFRAT